MPCAHVQVQGMLRSLDARLALKLDASILLAPLASANASEAALEAAQSGFTGLGALVEASVNKQMADRLRAIHEAMGHMLQLVHRIEGSTVSANGSHHPHRLSPARCSQPFSSEASPHLCTQVPEARAQAQVQTQQQRQQRFQQPQRSVDRLSASRDAHAQVATLRCAALPAAATRHAPLHERQPLALTHSGAGIVTTVTGTASRPGSAGARQIGRHLQAGSQARALPARPSSAGPSTCRRPSSTPVPARVRPSTPSGNEPPTAAPLAAREVHNAVSASLNSAAAIGSWSVVPSTDLCGTLPCSHSGHSSSAALSLSDAEPQTSFWHNPPPVYGGAPMVDRTITVATALEEKNATAHMLQLVSQ